MMQPGILPIRSKVSRDRYVMDMPSVISITWLARQTSLASSNKRCTW